MSQRSERSVSVNTEVDDNNSEASFILRRSQRIRTRRDTTPSMANTSQSQRRPSSVTENGETPTSANRRRSVAVNNVDPQELIQCIMAWCSKRGFVRDADLNQFFSAMSKDDRISLLQAAQRELSAVFGFKLIRDEDSKRYYLSTKMDWLNILEKQRNNADQTEVSEQLQKDGALMTALMYIFMTRRFLEKEDEDTEAGLSSRVLKEFINGVEKIPADTYTSWFGPPLKIAEFITQGWLSCKPVKNQDGDEEFFYKWGPRAEILVSKKKLLPMFCKIYNCELKDWPHHAKIAGLRKQ